MIIDEVCYVAFQEKLAERVQKAMKDKIPIKEMSGKVSVSHGGTYLVLKKLILEEVNDNVDNFSE